MQTVVAAVASDPNVWNAVWENEALQDFLQSQNTCKCSLLSFNPRVPFFFDIPVIYLYLFYT
jgi:hypothetical protein